jgi:alpha-tubulin suppressor-like RCC1 family protein
VASAPNRVAFALLLAAAGMACGRTGLLLDDVFDDPNGRFRDGGGGDGSDSRDGSADGSADANVEASPFDDAGTIDIGPVSVPNLPQVTAGDSHACVRTVQDDVFCWGLGAEGQLGNRSTDPFSVTAAKVAGLPPIARVSAGRKYTCALAKDQKVWCWGENLEGQLGRGTRSPVELEPAPIDALVGTVALSAGGSVGEGLGSHTCALDQDGAVWCWGRNSSGECALGTSDHALVPNKVALTAPS